MKAYLLVAAVAAFFVSSCEKKTETGMGTGMGTGTQCATTMNLTANTLTPTEGESVVITALKESGNDIFQWNGPWVNLINQSNTLEFTAIKPSQSGTYYCNKGNIDCNTSLNANITIKVKLKQEAIPCALTTNFVRTSAIADPSFTNVMKSFGGTFNTVSLEAYPSSAGYPSFMVLFNSYNGNVEPEDGTYYTANRQVFDVFQEPNEISISFIYQSVFFHSRAGGKVYVKHVNGKLEVNFCNLEFSSSSTSPVTCSGNIRET